MSTIVHSTTERLYDALKEPGRQAPVVEGDLQRVFTGCYTSLARLKRQAVKSLAGLVQTEALRTATWWQRSQEYPQPALDEAWRDHLFNDFHDILPGSCVEPAEQDALALYGKVSETTRRLRLGAAAAFNAGWPQPALHPRDRPEREPLLHPRAGRGGGDARPAPEVVGQMASPAPHARR